MKATDTKSSSKPAGKATPFFSKESGQYFFGRNPAEPAFFSKTNSVSTVQPKLSIGKPNDKYEQEADAMAEKVVQRQAGPDALQTKPVSSAISPLIQAKCSTCGQDENLQKKEEEKLKDKKLPHAQDFSSNPEPPDASGMVQRKCAACEQKEKLQAKTEGNAQPAAAGLESTLAATRNSGSPLPEGTRRQMETSFGADFSGIRIHQGSTSVQLNSALKAQAFTYGRNIYFNQGKFDPESKTGKQLLAHELTHVVQQNGAARPNAIQRDPEKDKDKGKKKDKIEILKPSNPIIIKNTQNTFSGSNYENGVSPKEFLPFDTGTAVWDEYLKNSADSINALGNATGKLNSKINPAYIPPSGKDLKNEVSFVTGAEGKGTAGGIKTNTELKALYDFTTYKWVPVNEGKVLPDPATFGKKAYPVDVIYSQTIQYEDSKQRKVTIEIYGKILFTPEQWLKELGIGIGLFSPTALLRMNGNFGSFTWTMKGNGPVQNYYYENRAGGQKGAVPNLLELSKLQEPKMLFGTQLPSPEFVRPYLTPGEQFVAIQKYLDSADKIYQDYMAKLPKAKARSSGGVSDADVDSGSKLPGWLGTTLEIVGGILLAILVIVGIILIIPELAAGLVAVAAAFGITLTIAAATMIVIVVLLIGSFLHSLSNRLKEGYGKFSLLKIIGISLLDTFGLGLLIECITDESLLSGQKLNQGAGSRAFNCTLGIFGFLGFFFGIRNFFRKPPTSSPDVFPGKIPEPGNLPDVKPVAPDITPPKPTDTVTPDPTITPPKPAEKITPEPDITPPKQPEPSTPKAPEKGTPEPAPVPDVLSSLKPGEELSVPYKGSRARAQYLGTDNDLVKIKVKSKSKSGDITQSIPKERFREMLQNKEVIRWTEQRTFLMQNRPRYEEGVVEKVWNNAKSKADGKVRDPNPPYEELTWDPTKSRYDQWHMGHKPQHKYSKLVDRFVDGEISWDEFIRQYNDPANYWPELPSKNMSHGFEAE